MAFQQIKERVAFTYDYPWWYPGQAIDRCSNIWASLPGAGYVSSEHKADSLIAKFKEAGGTVRDWCMSRVTAIISALVICIIVRPRHGLLIITVIPLPTKPSATKMPENWKLWTRQLLTCRCVSVDVAALDAKYTKELADAKAENDALGAMMLPLVVVCQTSAVRQSVRSHHRLRRG